MRKTCIALLGASLFAVPGMTKTTCVPTQKGYGFTFTVTNHSVENVTVGQSFAGVQAFSRVQVDDLAPAGRPGTPELAEATVDVALDSQHISVQVEGVKEDTLVLSHPLYPKQWPLLYGEEAPVQSFCFDPVAYSQGGNAREYVSVESTYRFRGQHAARLRIAPLRYDPQTRTLRIAKEIRFNVQCHKPVRVRHANGGVFEGVMRDKFINLRQDSGRAVVSEPMDKPKYLIIASPEFKDSPALKTLVDYRSAEYAVEVVDNKTAGDKKDAFRKFVRDKMPAYLLLVGKNTDFPYHLTRFDVGGKSPMIVRSYMYHVSATTTGRMQPDIALGLFMVSKEEDIQNIVNKTIATEKQLATLPKRFVGHGGNTFPMGSLPPEHCDNVVKEVFDTYVKQHGYELTWIKSDVENGAQSDVTACNEGVPFINYNGHGDKDTWVHGWGVKHLSQLTNTTYPFVLSCACYTGTFNSDPCMAADFVRHANGPCAFVGSYQKSSMGQHVLNTAMFDAIMNKKATFGMAFVYGCNADAEKYNPQATKKMFADESCMEMMTTQYHLFGDPAICTTAPAGK